MLKDRFTEKDKRTFFVCIPKFGLSGELRLLKSILQRLKRFTDGDYPESLAMFFNTNPVSKTANNSYLPTNFLISLSD